MPAIVGPIKINSVSGGVVNFGDSFYLSPKSASKSISGSGSGNTGDFHIVNNGFSISSGVDPDVNDQNQTANA
ncbi:spore germination protein [Bacillus alveayuensis]|uniref:Spore germination protein PF n=1 Tax=Aeribacillus alveayuensis TaxID=279215 RepID=A0ABT9VN28_9BACI|nr:spore germination protein [Bacillus alveayuensis]MDQ0162378.1 spore germination protein PF [Bacillus alveayuensis]